MGYAKIRGQLPSRIGQRVQFKPPKDVADRGGNILEGTIIDEVWADPAINVSPMTPLSDPHHWGDYSFASQLIKWDDGTFGIRLIYYRRRVGEDHWEFASQMTVSSDVPTIKALLERTLSKQSWFADPPHPEPAGD